MIVLKLVAWSDRPEERENDLADILLIIQHYFDLAFDEIVEFYSDTFPEDNFDQRIIAAEVLGRKAQIFLNKSEKLSARIHQVLASNLQDASKSQIARKWARTLESDVEYAHSILEAFQKGILNR
jgi:predicted nucleotidyltransferase